VNSRDRLTAYARGLVVIVCAIGLLRFSSWANAATATSVLLLSIVIVTRISGPAMAIVSSFLVAVVYLYFYIPPVGGFLVSNPNDWVALAAFIATAVLSAGILARAESSANREKHFEKLYWDLYATYQKEMDRQRAINASAHLSAPHHDIARG